MRKLAVPIALLVAIVVVAYVAVRRVSERPGSPIVAVTPARRDRKSDLTPFQQAILRDLKRQTSANIRYDNRYFRGGEPPPNIGVCTDVVIRSYRAAGVDLQRAVTNDIRDYPGRYPVTTPDPNIDHRRCRNLIVYFGRHATELPNDGDWAPGDVVFWSTANDGRPDHVGVVSDGQDAAGAPTVVHHWPGRPVTEADCLYTFTIVGHYRLESGKVDPAQ